MTKPAPKYAHTFTYRCVTCDGEMGENVVDQPTFYKHMEEVHGIKTPFKAKRETLVAMDGSGFSAMTFKCTTEEKGIVYTTTRTSRLLSGKKKATR